MRLLHLIGDDYMQQFLCDRNIGFVHWDKRKWRKRCKNKKKDAA